jgi:ectoine hydroxylase-related dioxygenase (phytanoyl-CoA dioxygenase family)
MSLDKAPACESKRFDDEGCVFPVPVMGADEAADHRRRLEEAEAVHGPMHYLTKPYLMFKSAAEIARHPALLDAVENVLGPNILLWDSAYVIKEARDPGYVSWHQDLTYWGLDSAEMVTAWVALSPSRPDTGCMRYIPGSHRGGQVVHEDTHADDNILHRGQQIAAALDVDQAVDIVLEPGQASLHHGWVVHGSNPNASDDRRIGLTMQYIAPSVCQKFSDQESATLVRGVDRYAHFRSEPECVEDFSEASVAFQRQAQVLKHAVYDGA